MKVRKLIIKLEYSSTVFLIFDIKDASEEDYEVVDEEGEEYELASKEGMQD